MFSQDAGLVQDSAVCEYADNAVLGHFAISKSGHDAGECYVIVSAAGNVACVANGRNRTIQKPKKKNLAHLFITKQSAPDVDSLLTGELVSSNLKLAGYVKNFVATQKKEGK